MSEPLERLRQTIQTLQDADEPTKCAADWLLLDIAHFLKKPTSRKKESVLQGVDAYLDAWIDWKGKT